MVEDVRAEAPHGNQAVRGHHRKVPEIQCVTRSPAHVLHAASPPRGSVPAAPVAEAAPGGHGGAPVEPASERPRCNDHPSSCIHSRSFTVRQGFGAQGYWDLDVDLTERLKGRHGGASRTPWDFEVQNREPGSPHEESRGECGRAGPFLSGMVSSVVPCGAMGGRIRVQGFMESVVRLVASRGLVRGRIVGEGLLRRGGWSRGSGEEGRAARP
jgi:hypothetical protein